MTLGTFFFFFCFFFVLLSSPVKSLPQNLGYVIDQDTEATSTPSFLGLKSNDDTLASVGVNENDVSSNRVMAMEDSKGSLDSVDNSGSSCKSDLKDDLVPVPLAFDKDNPALAILKRTENIPICEGSASPFCCSFKEPDQFGQEKIFEFYDCLTPEELRRTGRECHDEGIPRPGQLAWNKRWDCCASRVEETHKINEQIRKTWIGKSCTTVKPIRIQNQIPSVRHEIPQKSCPVGNTKSQKGLKLQSQDSGSYPSTTDATLEDDYLE